MKKKLTQTQTGEKSDKPLKDMLRILGKMYFIAIAIIPFAVIFHAFSHGIIPSPEWLSIGDGFYLSDDMWDGIHALVTLTAYGVFFYICCKSCLGWGSQKKCNKD